MLLLFDQILLTCGGGTAGTLLVYASPHLALIRLPLTFETHLIVVAKGERLVPPRAEFFLRGHVDLNRMIVGGLYKNMALLEFRAI
jgi:hypothetical protein